MLELVPYMTVKELAAELNVTRQNVWALVRRGSICPPIKISQRVWVWHKETAQGIIQHQKIKKQMRIDAGARNKKVSLKQFLKNKIEHLENQIRWRKWPEEKPIESGMYLVYTKWSGGKYCQRDCIVDIQFFYVNGEICDGGREWFTHWKPFAQPSSR